MQQGNDVLGALLTRLARPEWSAAGAAREPSHLGSPNPDALRLLPPSQRAEALCRQLGASSLLAEAPGAQRQRLLEGKPLLLATARELLGRPSGDDLRKAAALPIRLLNAQYQLEVAAVRWSCSAGFGIDLLGSYATAALDTLFELLLAYWHHQLPPPERLWNEAHALYQLACLQGLDTPGDIPRDARTQTLRTAYLKPQLLGSLNPARYRPAELRQVAAFVDRHADRAQLGGAEGLLCIDPESARPPTYVSRRDPPGCWRLCVRVLVQALDQDAATEASLMPRLKRDLGRYWTRRQVRSELHRRTAQGAVVTIGLEAAHQLLTGCGDDDALLECLAPSAAARAAPRCHETALAMLCIDRSGAGARFRLERGAAEAVLPGAFIAACIGDEPDCQLGLIRWVRRDADFHAMAGAQWLLPAPRPCAVQRLEPLPETPLLRAFFHADATGSGTLLVPAGIFKPTDRIAIHSGDGLRSAVITAVIDSTFHVSHFGIRAEHQCRPGVGGQATAAKRGFAPSS